jgi:hypothetical protein
MWEPQPLTTLRASKACRGENFTFYLYRFVIIFIIPYLIQYRHVTTVWTLKPFSYYRTYIYIICFPFGTKSSNSDFNNDLPLILNLPPPKQHSDARSILMLLLHLRFYPRNALLQWKFRYGHFDTKFVFHRCPERPSFRFLWNFPATILNIDPFQYKSRDSAVVIATSYGLDDWGVGVRVLVESRIFSSPNRSDRLWGPPNLLSNGYRGTLSPGVKRPGREADRSPPTSAKVKKM